MSKKAHKDRKATGQLLEADKSALSPDAAGKTLAKREAVVIADEQTAFSHAECAAHRQEDAGQREKDADAQTALSANIQAQMLEANERLVVATVYAQTMKDAADLALVQMSHMAGHDFLTGLPNRTLLTDRLAQAIACVQRHGKKVALLYLDFDHFKQINDSLGHDVGDKLLLSVAKRLQTCVRLSDTISRQGGDEFVVVLPEIEKAQDAVVIAEELINAMAQPYHVSGHRIRVTISIGISIYPDDGKDIEMVLKNADTAMYQAKKIGRNNYQVYIPEMNVCAVERQLMEQALNTTLEQHKFVLHYQPTVNFETGAITGAEALIRMQGSDNQLVCPVHFINVAEDCGLILPIGRWVLREACRQTQLWLQAGFDIGRIAVNVSFMEFRSKDFLDGVIFILNDTGLDPRRLELEMTENGLIEDTEPAMAILHALKKLGVQIAIDDFGTGYSSLGYLMRFPIDTLKIDQSFVQDLDNDSSDLGEAIVSTVIAMGKNLKKRVVAEGIETQQQLAFLQSHQCAEGQGYYFSRPVSADDFASSLGTGIIGAGSRL